MTRAYDRLKQLDAKYAGQMFPERVKDEWNALMEQHEQEQRLDELQRRVIEIQRIPSPLVSSVGYQTEGALPVLDTRSPEEWVQAVELRKQQLRLKADLERQFEAACNAYRPMVLTEGAKVESLVIAPKSKPKSPLEKAYDWWMETEVDPLDPLPVSELEDRVWQALTHPNGCS